MGEAKKRGSFEKRKQEGIEKIEADKKERELLQLQYEMSLTPAQKQRRESSRKLLAFVSGMAEINHRSR